MGNVVSSLLMYALQAAWYCQRLIDQDYRQNYGSRPKPITDVDETDLDAFLSKCRSYYHSRGWREQEALVTCPPPIKDSPKAKKSHHRSHSRSLLPIEATDYRLRGNDSDLDKEFLYVMDEPGLSGADVHGDQTGTGESDPCSDSLERLAGRKFDSPKSERWKRKLDRLRFPAGRSLDGTYFPQDSYCTADGDFDARGACDRSLNFEDEDLEILQRGLRQSRCTRLIETGSMTNHDRSVDSSLRLTSVRRRVRLGRSLDSPPSVTREHFIVTRGDVRASPGEEPDC